MKPTRILCLLVSFFFSMTVLCAQPDLSNETMLPPSPNASSLVKFAGSGVSYSNGSMQTSIPIQAMENGKLTPIIVF